MTALRVDKNFFSGTSKVFDGSLATLIRGILQDNARGRVQNAQVGDFTDNSGGTPASSIVNMVIPTAAFDATSAGGAQRAAFNTATGKIENAFAVLANRFNQVRARIGLPLITWADGTIAAKGTIPSQDTSVTSASGTSALDFADGIAKMKLVRTNMSFLVDAFNEIRAALGYTAFTSTLTRDAPLSHTAPALVAVAAAATSASGASSISSTVASAFLLASANNLASLAASWNTLYMQGELTDLTDSSGGTAAAGLTANPIPAAADGAATTSSPKAGFDTQLNVIENAISEVATQMNKMRGIFGLPLYTDSTGQTPNGTIESMSVDLTAVDGSSGTSAVEQASARAALAIVNNAMSSLAVGINEVCAVAGIVPLTDTGPVGTASTTLANIAATATGTSGAGATLLDADVDAYLAINRNNISSLVAKMNEITGSGQFTTKPLSAVAA